MTDDDSYVITYPCFFPTCEDGKTFLTVYVDGQPAIVFLSDEDLLARFFRERFPKQADVVVRAIKCRNRTALIDTLLAIENRVDENEIELVAIDPGGRHKCAYAPIRAFVEHLEEKRRRMNRSVKNRPAF